MCDSNAKHFTNEILEATDALRQRILNEEDQLAGGVLAMVQNIDDTIVNLKVLARGTAVANYLASRTALIGRPKGRDTS
ncbi:MAG: hypothetical protein Q7V53_02425 [Caldisericota bacterium]|nr:hypothetical protein [Caldisericota bacterium]